VVERSGSSGGDSRRVAEAHARADQRLGRQRGTLRPLGWAVILVVVASTVGADPGPGLHGKEAGVTLGLCVFVATLALTIPLAWLLHRFTRVRD